MQSIIILALLLGAFQVSADTLTHNPVKPMMGVNMNHLALTQDDKNKTFELATGESVVLSLQENPTTGYVWAVTGYEDVLALQESDYAPASSAIGSHGTRRFSFVAKKPGAVMLRFKLWREWEGDASIIESFNINIRAYAK